MKNRFWMGAGSLIFSAVHAWAAVVEGRVYLDANRNGALDADETGVARVAVSDGTRVTVTDATGGYRLETAGASGVVWICVPRDHIPSGTFWRTSDGARRENFGLLPQAQPDDFLFAHITDSHIGRADLMKRFAENLSQLPLPVMFVVNTGDLVSGVDVVFPDKAQEQYDRYLDAISAFRVPLFNLPGNHEHVSHNVKEADQAHPLYGKGLYPRLLGPMHYSWDWAGIHFVALDGTTLPYQERLGKDQLAWLKVDLQCQPVERPLVLFCHQSIPNLRDAQELREMIKDRKILGMFCGHLHRSFEVQFAGAPVYHSGALSGSWWSGPNSDGTPQGFRLVQIKGGVLKTVYTNREGKNPISIVAPLATELQSGTIEVGVSVLDYGKPVELSASYVGKPVALKPAEREELWSVWRGTVDTRLAFDGSRDLRFEAKQGEAVSAFQASYLVVNGRPEPFAAESPGLLQIQVRGINAPDELLFNGELLGVIPAGTTNEATLAFEIGRERIRKCNRLTVRAAAQGKGKDQFSCGPVWLEYKGKKIFDLRYVSFDRHVIVGDDPKRCEKELYYCLP